MAIATIEPETIENITVTYSGEFTCTGILEYDVDHHVLTFIDTEEWDDEVISTDLSSYGLVPEDEDEVFIKDWSEHSGIAEQLEEQSAIEIVESVVVGPFASTAYRCRVLYGA